MPSRSSQARRALVLHDRKLVVDLIELTLNHGLFVVRAADGLAEAEQILRDWQPHMAVIDMDHDDSTSLLKVLAASKALTRSTIPALGLTRRGDLKTKLRAFDLGVDDILTMPFSPEELLARSIVITRRALGTDHPIVPTIRLGEMEVDIVNRQVRAGDSVIHLSGIEQSLLYLLASRGVAPIPASSGQTNRMRLNRGRHPPDQPSVARDRAGAGPHVPAGAGVRRSQASRGQGLVRRPPGPQATPRPDRLPAAQPARWSGLVFGGLTR